MLLRRDKSFAIFWYVLVCNMWSSWYIMVVDMLTLCALLHSMCDWKAIQMNMQHRNLCFMSLNRAKMPHKQPKTFVRWKVQLITVQLSDGSGNFAWVARNIMIRYCVVSLKPWIPRLCFKPIEVNPARGTQKVAGELSIWQSRVVCLLRNTSKNHWSCPIVPHVNKILLNF